MVELLTLVVASLTFVFAFLMPWLRSKRALLTVAQVNFIAGVHAARNGWIDTTVSRLEIRNHGPAVATDVWIEAVTGSGEPSEMPKFDGFGARDQHIIALHPRQAAHVGSTTAPGMPQVLVRIHWQDGRGHWLFGKRQHSADMSPVETWTV